ncbi:MAG: hypothetical protein ACXWFU_06625 [Actinomycetota bacterium]
MESQGGSKPSFDIAAMSMATKGILIVGVLLLIDSFLPWQRECFEAFGVGGCASASAWGGTGGWAGVIMGILLIVLVLFEISKLANMSMQLPIEPSKATAYLGFAVVGFGVLKFILVLTGPVSTGFGAWVGIILLAALGYFSFLYLKAEETAVAPTQTEL